MSIIRLHEAPNFFVDVIVLPLISTFMKQIGKKEYFWGVTSYLDTTLMTLGPTNALSVLLSWFSNYYTTFLV